MLVAMADLDEIAEAWGVDMLKMDGFDDCCIGVVQRCGMEPILCYSYDKVIKQLTADGMTNEEAQEFFEFNQLGAWVGDSTPCFFFGGNIDD